MESTERLVIGMLQHTELLFSAHARPTLQCHASTIVETSAGFAAAWFGGEREGDPSVGIWFARRTEAGWSMPIEVANGISPNGPRVPCWNPVLFQPREGPLLLFYKQGFQIADWQSMLMESDDNGLTWSKPRPLAERIHGPVKNKPIQLDSGTVLCPTSDESDGWQIYFSRTDDLGRTWTTCGPYDGQKTIAAIQPALLTHPNGAIQALCRTRHACVGELWSYDQGRSWSDIRLTGIIGNNSGLDAITLRDGRHLLVNNPVAADWDGRNMLAVSISADGRNWRQVRTLEAAEQGEFSYPAVIQAADGMVHVCYTYLRRTIKHVVIDPALI